MLTPTPPPSGAFQLARSGQCRTTAGVQQRLEAVSDDTHQVTGPTPMKQLQAVIAQKSRPPADSRKL
jgi:hypothetical protein